MALQSLGIGTIKIVGETLSSHGGEQEHKEEE